MDRNVSSFTVLFQPPFWVGIAERWDEEGYSAARVVFGPEPTDAQLYQWLEREWHKLDFSPAAEGERPVTGRKNPKRARREAYEVKFVHGEYEGNELQLPATFVVEPDLTITFAEYHKGNGGVPSPDELAELLK